MVARRREGGWPWPGDAADGEGSVGSGKGLRGLAQALAVAVCRGGDASAAHGYRSRQAHAPRRAPARYQRSSRGPTAAPSAPVSTMPSVYQTATKAGEGSGHDSE